MNGLAFAVAATVLAAPAGAATFDFIDLANQARSSYGREVSFETVYPEGYTLDSLTVQATAGSSSVWMDSQGAGLGVCEIGDCNNHYLDGIDSNDLLTLSFDQPVRLTDMLVRESSEEFNAGLGPDHTPFSGLLHINDAPYSVADGVVQGLDLQGDSFTIRADALFGPAGGSVSQYVSVATVAPVPLPAAGFMLLAAFGAVVGLRRFERVRSVKAA